MVINYLEQFLDEAVSPMEFYRDIFPEGSFEEQGKQVDDCHVPNGIITQIKHVQGKTKAKRWVVTDDLSAIEKFIEEDGKVYWDLNTDTECLTLMNGIAYIGSHRKSENARLMYAMIIEVDGLLGENNDCEVDENGNYIDDSRHNGISQLFHFWENDFLPKPTYIVASGTGIHLYYVFKEPILLYPDTVRELTAFRKKLIFQTWADCVTSLYDSIQYESLFQAFRMVGTQTKYTRLCTAFPYGDKVDMDYMTDFKFFDDVKKDLIKTKKKKLTLAQCKAKYPEWYERRIVQKEEKGHWVNKKALYDWWIRKAESGYSTGHRYYCMMALAIYAVKCGIDEETLEEDMRHLYDYMKSKEDVQEVGKNVLTLHDMECAMQIYHDRGLKLATYPRQYIQDHTGIVIQPNKRNGRKQNKHLEGARAIQRINEEYEGKWREGNGRKPKQSVVAEWRAQNPNGKPKDCIADTGLSKNTVYKWWE